MCSTLCCWRNDSTTALNDAIDPAGSNDESIPRFTWWSHRGTTEWVQYDFDEPRWVSAADVYWFDDSGNGGCRTPARWRLLFRQGDDWKPVPAASGYGVERDRFNRVEWDPVETSAIRLEVELQDEYSAGLLEWRID